MYFEDSCGELGELATVCCAGCMGSQCLSEGMFCSDGDLILYGNAISALSPLETLSNVWTLQLADNSIADLEPLQQMTGLRRLYLSGNPIEDLTPLLGLPTLEYLCLNDTNIDCDLHADTLQQLQELHDSVETDC